VVLLNIMMAKTLLFLLVAVSAYRTIEACKSTTPIHCSWNGWVIGECSVPCGDGTRVNTRSKKVVERDGGSCSGPSTETKSCKEKECPIHCEWNDWLVGECTVSCGGGVRTNTRDNIVSAEHGGDECTGLSSLEESCNVDECPVDCEWGNWEYGVCSQECGGGTQPMFRIKTEEALFGGIECEGEGYGEQECNPQPCPVDCVWNDWELGECSVTCAGGTRIDTRTIFSEAMHGGFCDPEGDLRVKECNTEACPPIHCEWDDWVVGECSALCGTGTRINLRTKLVEEVNGGTCTGHPEEMEECKDKECPVHCEWEEWQIEECSLECGGGTLTKTRVEKVSAEHGGDSCEGVTSIEESCNEQECPVDCIWSEWTIGECSQTCGEGVRGNTRVMFGEKFGGKPCEGDSSATESCLIEECPVCPKEKSSFCQTYVNVKSSLCASSWFTDANGSYACQKSCGLC